MIMQARNIATAQVMTVMAGGGQGSFGGFNELIEQGKSVGMFQKLDVMFIRVLNHMQKEQVLHFVLLQKSKSSI